MSPSKYVFGICVPSADTGPDLSGHFSRRDKFHPATTGTLIGNSCLDVHVHGENPAQSALQVIDLARHADAHLS
jgi:hypothetical protein